MRLKRNDELREAFRRAEQAALKGGVLPQNLSQRLSSGWTNAQYSLMLAHGLDDRR
ncbi:MAG: hypothetical protein M0R06_16245 [Sphaerochaeta sp.]|jgi:hypothetical protein|nr:hypothetical protein [Sphaerochaeta sp.]